ncbi:MAG: polysaccharide deacetylase family protein [Clostridiales bacterium]|jgi:peptidoglycan/xylan/chitin deacetylase (PgdA/CDA1 family)|nr:polysaccharide deacetylase family protein [Clostridiales bacterium]
MNKLVLLLSCALIVILGSAAAFPPELGGEAPREEEVSSNESGEILIIMYHGLTKGSPKEPYMRSIADFKRDLRILYDKGYRLISMADFLDNNIAVPAGTTPVIFTFDDGYDTSFSLERDENGQLALKKDCAADIMNEFYKEHPDFGRTGVFFICTTGMAPFVGDGTLAERFKYLTDLGFELGNHTGSHDGMRGMSAREITKDMAEVEKMVRDNLPGYKMRVAAYPYGHLPSKNCFEAVLKGEYDGVSYDYDLVLRERKCGYSSLPYSWDFDKFNVPRVRASNNSTEDLHWCIENYEKHPEKRYISDGDPDVISIPAAFAEKLNLWRLAGKVIKVVD